MINLKDSNTPILIVEILILQRFPYGQDSTFFYFATGKLSRLSIGDIVTVPFRKGMKMGVVVQAVKTKTGAKPKGSWQINLWEAVSNKEYFYSPLPDRKIKLKPVESLLEKKFLSSDLLSNLRLAARIHCVSWNHFVNSVVNLPPGRKNIKTDYLSLLGKWFQEVSTEKDKLSEKKINIGDQSLPYVFASQEQSFQLISLLRKNIQGKKHILVIVPEKTHLLPIAAKYVYLSATFASSTPIILGKFLPASIYRTAWQLTRSKNPHIFIGTRSSIFAPFSHLGLIIIEDGQDNSHKQWDLTPLYDVRNILPLLYPKVIKIYVSSTPRLHDFYSSPLYLMDRQDELKSVVLSFPPPKSWEAPNNDLTGTNESPLILRKSIDYANRKKLVSLVNMSKNRGFTRDPVTFSDYLKKELKTSLKKGKWAVILASHGGFANFIVCRDCGYIPRCPQCGKALKIHVKTSFNCDYCGVSLPAFSQCPSCSGHNFVISDFGLENIKEKLTEFQKKIDFKLIVSPDPKSSNKALRTFWQDLVTLQNKPVVVLGFSGILTLARLLSKNIGIAASLSFDNLLFHPDYRSEERAAICYYNLLSAAPKIIIQTRDPIQPFWQKVLAKPYSALFSSWLKERLVYNYPPFCDLVRLDIPATNSYHQKTISDRVVRLLNQENDVRDVLVVPPKDAHGKDKYVVSVLAKLNKNIDSGLLWEKLFREFGKLKVDPDPEILI